VTGPITDLVTPPPERPLPEIPGVRLGRTLPTREAWAHHLILALPRPCTVLSSAPWGGGFSTPRVIVNRSVAHDWACPDPVAEMTGYLEHLGLPPAETVGLLTAVGMAELRVAQGSRAGWRVHTLLTAGVGNAAAAGGRWPLVTPHISTINLIILVEGALSPSALVGAVGSATEAKVAALHHAGVKTRFGEAATGTTTDTVTVVNLSRHPRSPFAGLATAPGHLVAETVYAALSAHLQEAP
jgi:adenosylcobinamide hydrolase